MLEILVVLVLVGILAALLFPALGQVLRKGDRVQRLSSLREIGGMVHLFAADHAGRLPGPLWPGQIPVYDPNRGGRLAGELAPYLNLNPEDGVVSVPELLPEPLSRARPQGVTDGNFRSYVMNMDVRDRDDAWFNPWGSLVDGSEPVGLARFAARSPAVWGFSEADQQHPRVASAPWGANTIPEPLPRGRLAWFFDGSVNALPNSEIESP